MTINASLFAVIQNDAFLSGTYKLEGHQFSKTTEYLNEYFSSLKISGEAVSDEYLTLIRDAEYLEKIERDLNDLHGGYASALSMEQIAASIAHHLDNLAVGSSIMLPGGWFNQDGGHAMIYQFTRKPDGYHFIVFNSGDGIQHHSKKSMHHKERYNPMKTWSFPQQKTHKGQTEIQHFIQRLLKTRLPGYQKKAMTADILYDEIFPTISFIDGVEINADEGLPEHVYTGGQLSGTCAQRCIHQMLKANSYSEEEFQRFIFKFKRHALFDYWSECNSGRQPFNAGVADQLCLAIDNNLKIVNIVGLFTEDEKERHFAQLTELKNTIQKTEFNEASVNVPEKKAIPELTFSDVWLKAPKPVLSVAGYEAKVLDVIDLKEGKQFIEAIEKQIREIRLLNDPLNQYFYLEQLILALPLNKTPLFDDAFYAELNTLEDYNTFLQQINDMQSLIKDLGNKLFKKEQTPAFRHLTLSVLSLKTDVHSVIAQKNNRPSFDKFNSVMMGALVGNHERDAFEATDDAVMDQRVLALRKRYDNYPKVVGSDYQTYYKGLLQTESQLNEQLNNLYTNQFGQDTSRLHQEIRKNGLESLYMVSMYLQNKIKLDEAYRSLINKIAEHYYYESDLRKAINPFFTLQLSNSQKVDLGFLHDSFCILSPLYPTYIEYQELATSMTKHKYPMKDSPALQSMLLDVPVQSVTSKKIKRRTANDIQLVSAPSDEEVNESQMVTQGDIIARDYHHLRSVPSFQIALTLDYFTRNVSRLADESNQRYVEANIFQPGLLLESLKNKEFLEQFDTYLKSGKRFFVQNGHYTKESLSYVRLNFLVSNYMTQLHIPEGNLRLIASEDELTKQLAITQDPDVLYVMQQYYFLTLMVRMESGENDSEFFATVFNAYYYLMSHTNPNILEDTAHNIDVAKAISRFKILASKQSEHNIENAVTGALIASKKFVTHQLTGKFPVYSVTQNNEKLGEVNVLLGMLFQQGLARSGVPLFIRNHPLIKQLGLHEVQECLVNSDKSYMILQCHGEEIYLFYKDNSLTVQKEWTVNGKKQKYELQALTAEHLAKQAHTSINAITTDAPKLLTDGTMNYWKRSDDITDGLLVSNNVPAYLVTLGRIRVLDSKGNATLDDLTSYDSRWRTVLNRFESNSFIISQSGASLEKYRLERFGLSFDVEQVDPQTQVFLSQQTNEQVIDVPSPIHPAVAGLVLEGRTFALAALRLDEFKQLKMLLGQDFLKIINIDSSKDAYKKVGFTAVEIEMIQNALRKDASATAEQLSKKIVAGKIHKRFIVPVQRFYPTEQGAKTSDFYPFIHDNEGVIAQAILNDNWKKFPPLTPHLWHYQGCEKYVGFQLKNDEPIADSVADALYLAYIYLAANQTEKAWKTLEQCTTRFGGLKGNPEELKYISWICNDLPYIAPSDKSEIARNKPVRNTPPYVACRLKAMSILSDFYLQDGKYNLEKPSIADGTANSQYALLQHEKIQEFVDKLPETIYQTYTRYQTMGRYVKYAHTLSKIERKRLLDYYSQSIAPDKAPLGALGYEWMSLNLEALVAERETLFAQRATGIPLSISDEKRLNQIDEHLINLDSVKAYSTQLVLVPIKLALPEKSSIKRGVLSKATTDVLDKWHDNLMSDDLAPDVLQRALDVLSSNITDHDFINHFPAYLQIAASTDGTLSESLMGFCTKTLLAKRHISLDKQESNIPMLCNILYRVTHNHAEFNADRPKKFADLVKKISKYNVPKLEVYQAKDVDNDILATPEVIMAQHERFEARPIVITPLASRSLIQQMGIDARLHPLGLIASYQKILESNERDIIALGKKLTHDLQRSFSIEDEAGKRLLALEKEKNSMAQALMKDSTAFTTLGNAARDAAIKSVKQTDALWKKALILANKGPGDPVRARTWAIEKESGVRAAITKADLMSLYTRADLAYSIEKTGLSDDDARDLHHLVHESLVQGIRYQSVDTVAKSIKKASQDRDVLSAVKALDLLSRPDIPGLDTPAIVLLQHEESILLHNRQVSALKNLLGSPKDSKGFNEVIEKVIMGGGKSKVILPILAEKKARGDNLVIVEVPQALLATNHEDLNKTSQRLFGKRAYRFDFNRDSNCSPEHLEHIYKNLIEIMMTKGYMVTTAEAIQSLELKYLELLLAKEDAGSTWEKQVYWCDKITSLIRNQGDCIIDEVHQGLSIKKKINYTSGEPIAINPDLIKNATALFSLIDPEFIKSAHELPVDYDWTNFKKTLAEQLVNDSASPLSLFIAKAVKQHGDTARQEVIAYLTNKAKKLSPLISKASVEDRNALAFFKQEINVLLPQTLNRRLNENYGASKRNNLSPVEQTLAIPYAANNIANERSRFGNVLEAINYTIQMMLISGVSESLLKERIVQWQVLARQELFQNPALKQIDDTPTAKGFALLASKVGVTLSQIDLNNKEQFAKIHAYFKFNKTLINELLQEQSLKQINHDKEIIHSDSFNHVDSYRSTQGVAGTPSNHTTYHQRLRFDKTASLGTDGFIINLLRDKKTTVKHIDYKEAYSFIESILSQSAAPEHTRAIIDIRPTFLGVSNLVVAQEIARYLNTKVDQEIKHVLYFDENQVLCAINLNKPDAPIILGTTDENEITRLLGSAPSERFTYYDQVHSVGIDIKQDDKANALVLVDEKTSLQSFLQGDTRMRGLSQVQTLEIIVPESLKGKSLDELTAHFETVDRENLLQDNLTAAKLNMTNFLRRKCLTMIQNLPSKDAVGKRKLTQIFKPFFVDTPNTDLYELYGAISEPQNTVDILDRHQEYLYSLWTNCLQSVEQAKLVEDDIKTKLQDIINKALPYCLEQYEGTGQSFAMEVEVQTEMQKQTQVEFLALNEFYDEQLKEVATLQWPDDLLSVYKNSNNLMSTYAITMNIMCKNDQSDKELFSSTLHVSKNYAEVYKGQQKHIGAFLKPTFLIWYHLNNGVLQATIVTPQEAEIIGQRFQAKELPGSWIATTQNTFIAGHRPDNIVNDKAYQSLREQVSFFNGEFSSMLSQDSSLQWLQDETIEKLNYYENNLMRYRPESGSGFQQIKTVLTQASVEGFKYILQHCFEDLTQIDWKKIIPNTITIQAVEYKKVAEAFVYINSNIDFKQLKIEQIQQQFNLSLGSLDYVNEHLKHVQGVYDLFKNAVKHSETIPLSARLSKMDMECLETCLGMSLSDFLKAEGIKLPEHVTPSNVDIWRKADFKILCHIFNYPLVHERWVTHPDLIMAMIKAVSSADDLIELTKLDPITDVFFARMIHHPLSNEAVITELIQLEHQLVVEERDRILIQLAEQCKNNQQINLLLDKEELPKRILGVLLYKPIVSEDNLLKMIPLINNDSDFYAAYIHQSANENVRNAIYQHPLFSADRFARYISSYERKSNNLAELLEIHRIRISTLLELAKGSHSSDLLMNLVSYSGVTPALIQAVIANRFAFTPAVAYKILAKDGLDSISLEFLIRQTIYMCNMKTKDWDGMFRAVCDYCLSHNKTNEFRDILHSIKINNLKTHFTLLNYFGNEYFIQLPLMSMVEKADEDELYLLLNFEKTGILSEDLLLRLAERCDSDKEIDTLLERPDLTEPVLNIVLNNEYLNEHQLQQIVRFNGLSDAIQQRIFNHNATTKRVRDATKANINAENLMLLLNSGKELDKNELIELLSHPTAISREILQVCVQMFADKEEVLFAVVSHPLIDNETINMIMNKGFFSPEVIQKIIEWPQIEAELLNYLARVICTKCTTELTEEETRLWHKFRLEVFAFLDQEQAIGIISKVNGMDTPFGFYLLHRYDEEIIDSLPFFNMLAEAKSEDLDLFIHREAPYDYDQLWHLAKKTNDPKQIDLLLDRPDMTTDIADILLVKPEYSGMIGEWKWPTEQQLLLILDKASDYDSFYKAFTHPNLTKSTRAHWFKELKSQHLKNSAEAESSGDPKAKIMASIEVLKIKAVQHASKSLKTDNYAGAAEASFKLYLDLRNETDNFFEAEEPNKAEYKVKCDAAFARARPVLADHRGSKQDIIDIFNVILAFITGRDTHGDRWRFFEAETVSVKTANKVADAIDENIDPNSLS